MPIKVTCDECFTTLTVGSQHAGKVAKCKTCGARVRIPVAEEVDEPQSSGPSLVDDEVEERSLRRRNSKPGVKKRKSGRNSKSGDGSNHWKSVAVTVVVVLLFGFKFAGRINRHWKAHQARQGAAQDGWGGQQSGQLSTENASSFNQSAASDPSELYSLTDAPIHPPEFSSATFREIPTSYAKAYIQSVPMPGASPGTLAVLGVYLPPGDHEPGSLPCILFAPAGTPMIHGNPLDGNPENPEFAPYVKAGFAVVEFSLDGWYDSSNPSDAAALPAYQQFSAASAGVKNADAAFRFARNNLPAVNPKQIYIAGHSSAGTLALLYAAHQPQLAGCIAYAPQVDVEGHLREALSDPRAHTALPGIRAFVKRSSPDSHVSQIRVPVFAFHAIDDEVTSCAKTRQFCNQLREAGGDVKFVEAQGADHYQTMISPGLQTGIKWVASRVGPAGTVAVDASSPAPAQSPASTAGAAMSSPFRPVPSEPSDPASTPLSPDRPVSAAPEQFNPAPPTPATEPSQTRTIETESSLVPGTRVIAHQGLRWVGGEVVENLPGQMVKIHFLQLPAAFDKALPWSHVRLPLAEPAIDKDALETLRYNLIQVPQGGAAGARPLVEAELLALEGYVADSLNIDIRAKRVALKVVRGSSAETEATFALLRGQLFVTEFKSTRR